MDFLNIFTGFVGIITFISVLLIIVAISRYRRCPSNQILVVFGKVGRGRSAKCIHGGGTFIIPLIQDYKYMSLQPMTIEINLSGALSKQNIRINTPSTFTVAISTEQMIMLNAAERLLGMSYDEIMQLAEDIILGQLRLVIATLDIEEINQDRELFLKQVNDNVTTELNKIGLQLINVNIKDITDESGYIEAIGKKSAAEAINKAKVAVAEQERNGSIGESKANREREVQVAFEFAEAEKGRKEAEKNQRIAIAHFETESATEEAKANKLKEVEVASQNAQIETGIKASEIEKRMSVAEYEASAIEKENIEKARIASYNATLAEENAKAQERSQVARAKAEKEILSAERSAELARLEKEEVVRKEIEKKKIEIAAEAEAEKNRRLARGEADSIRMRYDAEAQGMKELIQAKADGYNQLIKACNNDTKMAATLMLLEKMETLVDKQVEAISNLKIDKITVWDSGNGSDGGTTSNFIRNFITSMPPLQDLASQVGIELPKFLGTLKDNTSLDNVKGKIKAAKEEIATTDEEGETATGEE